MCNTPQELSPETLMHMNNSPHMDSYQHRKTCSCILYPPLTAATQTLFLDCHPWLFVCSVKIHVSLNIEYEQK